MQNRILRRQFLLGIGGAAVATAVSGFPLKPLCAGELLYPPMDLSYFDRPIPAAPFEMHIGYASITWGGNDRQAIEDISAVGYSGIQLRANAVQEFGSGAAVKEVLEAHRLKMVALSSGNLGVDPGTETTQIAQHVANAKFLREAGGLYLQIIDQKPKGREVTPADYKRIGQLLTELGKQTADLGVQLGYHNHMGAMGQTPDGVEQIMGASDPRYVKLELDIAHYFQGRGDPARAVEQYADRLLFLHLKDVEKLSPTAESKAGYRFIELGRGSVDVPAVLAALKKVNFRGWGIIELDGETDKTRTPKESAVINKKYVEEKLGLKV